MAKREYIEANKRWLEEKAKETGVKCLTKGVLYKVIKQGETGDASPSPSYCSARLLMTFPQHPHIKACRPRP